MSAGHPTPPTKPSKPYPNFPLFPHQTRRWAKKIRANMCNHVSGKWGPVWVRGFIQRVRSVFKYGCDAGLLDRPMRFGPGFALPSKKTIRLERARKGPRMFEAGELRRVLATANPPVCAMILLG